MTGLDLIVGAWPTAPHFGHCIARLNRDGTPDQTFGNAGSLSLGLEEAADLPRLLHSQDPLGRVIVEGSSKAPPHAPHLKCLLSNGTIDSARLDSGGLRSRRNSNVCSAAIALRQERDFSSGAWYSRWLNAPNGQSQATDRAPETEEGSHCCKPLKFW